MYRLLNKSNRGMVLVLTLVLILTLTMMASAMIITVNNYSDLTASVTNKPSAINIAESCIDQAIVWLQTPDGKTWMALGVGSTIDIASAGNILYGKNLIDDTIFSGGEIRSDTFKSRISKASCTTVTLEVLKKISTSSSSSGVGTEVGTVDSYDSDSASSSPKYSVKITAEGIFNTPTLFGGTIIDEENWATGSSKSKVEIILEYQT